MHIDHKTARPELIARRYRVIRAVGRGGMGAVWLCRDQVLDRDVALKQIEGLEHESAAKAARPLREARLAAALDHENAVSMFDIVEDHGSTWLVMEYVPSRTLAEVLRAEGRLPVDRVVRIGVQVASALATAHALGIIHRDIKPSNVLVGDNDLAKISDFGIARGHQDEQLTMTGFVTGTPAYFSPELARGADPSQASDVWALGATLYAAVEGGPPYGVDTNPLALLARIASQPPPPPAHAGPLTSTVGSMLNPDPEARASMEGAVASLHRLAEPTDPDAARIREKRRAYADTTLQDRPVGALGALGALGAISTPGAPPAAADERSTVVTPEAQPTSPLRARGSTTEHAPPAARTSVRTTGGRGSGRGRPTLSLLIVGLALLLVLLMAGAVLWTALRSPAGDDTSGGPTGVRNNVPASNGDHKPSGSTQHTPSNTEPTTPQDTATNGGPTTPRTSHSARPPAPGAGPAGFVSSYFSLVPDDLETGWTMLSPSMRQIGRDSYERFWGSIDSVEVADVHAVDPDSVEYQITYDFSDGRVVQERQRIDLVPHGDSFWITDDTVLSSTELHP